MLCSTVSIYTSSCPAHAVVCGYTFIALFLSLVSTCYCDFMLIEFYPEVEFEDGTVLYGRLAFGMFSRGKTGAYSFGCLPWTGVPTDVIWDSAYKAAVVFAFFANISVILGFFMSIFLVCRPPGQLHIRITGILFGLGFLWHILMFVAFDYEVCHSRTCAFSSTAWANVTAAVMILISTVAVFRIQPYQKPDTPALVPIPEDA